MVELLMTRELEGYRRRRSLPNLWSRLAFVWGDWVIPW